MLQLLLQTQSASPFDCIYRTGPPDRYYTGISGGCNGLWTGFGSVDTVSCGKLIGGEEKWAPAGRWRWQNALHAITEIGASGKKLPPSKGVNMCDIFSLATTRFIPRVLGITEDARRSHLDLVLCRNEK